MRFLLPLMPVLLFAGAVSADPARAQENRITKKHDAWGRFDVGAWRLVKGTEETLDELGRVTSKKTKETHTSLEDVSEQGVTLLVNAEVQIGNRRYTVEPRTIKQGFHGELIGLSATVEDLGTEEIVVEGRRIACRVQGVEVVRPEGRRRTRIFYSDSVTPYILRRESTMTDPDGETTLMESVEEILATGMPCRVLAEVKPATLIRAVYTHPKGKTVTTAFVSTEVPGGVVAHCSKELDSDGRVVRRNLMELLDYGRDGVKERTGLFSRRRPPRPW